MLTILLFSYHMEPEDEEVLEQNEAVGVVGEGGPHVVAGQSPLLRNTPLIATGALNLGGKIKHLLL